MLRRNLGVMTSGRIRARPFSNVKNMPGAFPKRMAMLQQHQTMVVQAGLDIDDNCFGELEDEVEIGSNGAPVDRRGEFSREILGDLDLDRSLFSEISSPDCFFESPGGQVVRVVRAAPAEDTFLDSGDVQYLKL